jgi:hypothetical protein
MRFRSLFSDVPLRVRRLLLCSCQGDNRAKSATILDPGGNAVAPELAYITACYAALAPSGKVVALLSELLPRDRLKIGISGKPGAVQGAGFPADWDLSRSVVGIRCQDGEPCLTMTRDQPDPSVPARSCYVRRPLLWTPRQSRRSQPIWPLPLPAGGESAHSAQGLPP